MRFRWEDLKRALLWGAAVAGAQGLGQVLHDADERRARGVELTEQATRDYELGLDRRARRGYRKALELLEESCGREHELLLPCLLGLGHLAWKRSKHRRAEGCYRRLVEIALKLPCTPQWFLAEALIGLGRIAGARKQWRRAGACLGEAHWRLRELLGDEHPETRSAAEELMGVLPADSRH